MYLHCRVRSNCQRGIPSTNLALPHICACPKPGHGIPMPYYFFNTREIVRFDDIDVIVDLLWLNLTYSITYTLDK